MIPPWRGEALAGKTILLYSELGFGDEILSLRFAKPVKDMGARVIISVRSPIVRLARSLAFVDAVVRQYGPAVRGSPAVRSTAMEAGLCLCAARGTDVHGGREFWDCAGPNRRAGGSQRVANRVFIRRRVPRQIPDAQSGATCTTSYRLQYRHLLGFGRGQPAVCQTQVHSASQAGAVGSAGREPDISSA